MVWGAKMILWVYILWHSIITIIQCLIIFLWIRQQNPQNLNHMKLIPMIKCPIKALVTL